MPIPAAGAPAATTNIAMEIAIRIISLFIVFILFSLGIFLFTDADARSGRAGGHHKHRDGNGQQDHFSFDGFHFLSLVPNLQIRQLRRKFGQGTGVDG